ncbi:MAG: hypothetical protein HOP19_15180 [Acidobacteria bacterium]|nr:hypothetical protein [Acidobacteriota bacterium]
MAATKKSSAKATVKQRKNSEKNTDELKKKLANLKPFKPGQSGNPTGRPKGVLFLGEAYKKQLSKLFPDDPDGRTYAEVIAEKVCDIASTGDFKAAKEIADRTEGRAKQAVEITLPKTEAAKYEAMIENLQAKAAAKGTPITRQQAIETLAVFDGKILALMGGSIATNGESSDSDGAGQ